jgi:hypothetical protein
MIVTTFVKGVRLSNDNYVAAQTVSLVSTSPSPQRFNPIVRHVRCLFTRCSRRLVDGAHLVPHGQLIHSMAQRSTVHAGHGSRVVRVREHKRRVG